MLCADRCLRSGSVLCALLVLFAAPRVSAAQQAVGATGWNDARAVQLMQLARERRAQPLADTTLHNYRARAEGIVYFYLDRRSDDERILIKTDQVALEVFWAQPDLTKQRIVGLRDRSALPNRMYYHLDHLTVVQNGFGDVMRMGDGDEVSDVPHPAAPGSDSIYDFRLTDSLTLRLPGRQTPIKAYRIDVRPKRMDRSAIIGSVFVDHEGGDIVRMTFTFTPVSYVDRRLERINVSLDNGLWRGRYWLPNEQAVEIRRQIPELDFVATSVIQGRFRVTDYAFNEVLPEQLFWGYPVVALPRDVREAYPFDRDIYADLHQAGLAPPPELSEVRARAAELVRQRVLSGLPRLRLSLPNASQVFRYDRATGVHVGAGLSYAAGLFTRIESDFGYAFGAAQPSLRLGLVREIGERGVLRADAYLNAPRDIGVRPGAPTAFNTLSSLAGEDYMDAWWASGASIGWSHRLGNAWRLGLTGRIERHDAARLVDESAPLGGEFRPVRPIDEGTNAGGTVSIERAVRERAGWSWGARLAVEVASFEREVYTAERLDVTLRRGSVDRTGELQLRLASGILTGAPPAQAHFLAGGRNTIPGYAYRSFAGDAFALADLEATRAVLAPWLHVRLLAAAGLVGDVAESALSAAGGATGGPAAVRARWNAVDTDGLRTSLGAGIAFGWNVMRLDVVRGLGRGGEWQLLLSVDPRLWGVL